MLKQLLMTLCVLSFAFSSSTFSAPNKNAYKNANENASFKNGKNNDRDSLRDEIRDKYDRDDLKDKYDGDRIGDHRYERGDEYKDRKEGDWDKKNKKGKKNK